MLAYQYQSDGVQRLVDLPEPEIGDVPGGLIIDVAAAGICGTDLKIARGEHRMYPAGTIRVPGHEFSGIVAENDSGRADLVPGTRVAVAPNIACRACSACRAGKENLCENYESFGLTFNGGFARRVAVPAAAVRAGNMIIVPDKLDLATASLMEPVAAVVRGLTPLNLKATDTVLICGAGPMGLIALIVAKQLGVARVLVSQTSPTRRALAEQFGADATFDPRAEDLAEQVMTATGGWGADAVIAATPKAEVFADALRCAAIGGRINFFAGLPASAGAIPLEANLVHYKELIVTGSTANTNEDCAKALEIVAGAPTLFASLITDRLPLEAADDAFALAAGGTALKVIMEPQA
ncbi:MAG: zinc-binding dehydrogenase [Ancrocorticia sp.]|uniref:zinc-binding dehydrogenase n=1 Tax=Ancrocorticia sp. TaxID=2593684 RepID=UPI003F91C0D0